MNMCSKNWTMLASSFILVTDNALDQFYDDSLIAPDWADYCLEDMIDIVENQEYVKYLYDVEVHCDNVPDIKFVKAHSYRECYFFILSNRTARLFKYNFEKRVLMLEQCIHKNKCGDYVYISGHYIHQPPHMFKTELEAFQYAKQAGHQDIMVSKFATRWFGKPGAMIGEPSTPNVGLLYAKEPLVPRDDPQKMYDYLMRIVGCEAIYYTSDGTRIKSYWMLGTQYPKGYSDFMRPDFFQDMIQYRRPLWWSHEDEEDKVLNYGNVLTGDNVTHMKGEEIR